MSALQDILDGKGRTVHRVPANATVLDAVGKMCRNRIGALLVEEDGKPIGIVSERDVMVRTLLEERDPKLTRVADIMTKDVLSIEIDQEPEEAMVLMTQHRVRHLPVVERSAIVGIVSIGDLVRWVSRNQDFEVRVLRDYVSSSVYPG